MIIEVKCKHCGKKISELEICDGCMLNKHVYKEILIDHNCEEKNEKQTT